jgi:hypothetical protein
VASHNDETATNVQRGTAKVSTSGGQGEATLTLRKDGTHCGNYSSYRRYMRSAGLAENPNSKYRGDYSYGCQSQGVPSSSIGHGGVICHRT